MEKKLTCIYPYKFSNTAPDTYFMHKREDAVIPVYGTRQHTKEYALRTRLQALHPSLMRDRRCKMPHSQRRPCTLWMPAAVGSLFAVSCGSYRWRHIHAQSYQALVIKTYGIDPVFGTISNRDRTAAIILYIHYTIYCVRAALRRVSSVA